MPKSKRRAFAWAVAWACLALTGCGGSSDSQLFQKGEDLYRAARFQEAVPVFKQFLLKHPDHSGAHLYLGGCYQFSDQWSFLAQGEIETALYYFHRDGNKSTIPRFSNDYFELRCYLDLIKIQYARLTFAISPQAPPQILPPILNDFQHSVAEAQRIAPDNAEVQGIAKTAEEVVRLAQQVAIQRGVSVGS
jgi:hypothetical protein